MSEQKKNIEGDSWVKGMSVVQKIERYLKAADMPPTRFGRLAVRDPRLFHDLKRGRQPGPRMVARIEAYIARNPAP